MKKTKLLIGLLLIVFLAKAQENPKKCGTTPLMEYEIKTNPQYKNIVENYLNALEEWLKNNPNSKNSVITIPVVVHVIHRQNHVTIGSGTNIHDNQINNAIIQNNIYGILYEYINTPSIRDRHTLIVNFIIAYIYCRMHKND